MMATESPGTGRGFTGRTVPCAACRQRIRFVRLMVNPETGKGGGPVPIDLDPNPAGNIAVRQATPNHLVGRTITKNDSVDWQIEQLAMPHFATCPGTGEGRQPRTR